MKQFKLFKHSLKHDLTLIPAPAERTVLINFSFVFHSSRTAKTVKVNKNKIAIFEAAQLVDRTINFTARH